MLHHHKDTQRVKTFPHNALNQIDGTIEDSSRIQPLDFEANTVYIFTQSELEALAAIVEHCTISEKEL